MNGLAKNFITVILVFAMQLPYVSAVFAQSSPDTRSPLIELEALAESQADNSQVFTAQVVDDRVLKDVVLYHRRTGQQPFTPISMNPIGESGYFSASVKTDPTDLRAIEYYIQARDEGGNRTVEGYAFDPYTRVLTAGDAAFVSVPETNSPSTTSPSIGSKIRWWHVVAGIVVVGALASASGGSSGGSGVESGEGTVPLTINVTGP